MLGKMKHSDNSLFEQPLSEVLNPEKPLYKLANKIDWDFIEENLSKYYSRKGRKSHPVRLMAGLLILKSVRNLSDEVLVDEQWEENGFYQYFCGVQYYQKSKPCASSDLVHFRKRIGSKGIEIIMKASIDIHDKPDTKTTNNKEEVVYADTTVQQKNITFPTDAKLHKKIIDKCNKIAHKEGIGLKNNFKKKSQRLLQDQHNRTHPKRREKALVAANELRRIAGVIVRDLRRKLITGVYDKELALFESILSQEKSSKDKIYSLHEPEVHCIGKGKAHKKYEFGSKFGVLWSKERGIILAGLDCRNKHDGHSLAGLIDVHNKLNSTPVSDVYCDRGYRGAKVKGVQVHTPKNLKTDSQSIKRKKRKHFRNRAGIEPVISHLKRDFRMQLNYLKGKMGDAINGLMACAAFNFKKWMKSFSCAQFLDAFYDHIFEFLTKRFVKNSFSHQL